MTPRTVEIERSNLGTLTAVVIMENGEPRGYFFVNIDETKTYFTNFTAALHFFRKEQTRLWQRSLKLLENRATRHTDFVISRRLQ